jgi:hypothetical protein
MLCNRDAFSIIYIKGIVLFYRLFIGGERVHKRKGEKNMATSTIHERFTLDEASAQKIISTPRTVLRETNVFNDIKLNTKERIAHAAKILKSRKCK